MSVIYGLLTVIRFVIYGFFSNRTECTILDVNGRDKNKEDPVKDSKHAISKYFSNIVA